MYQSANRAGWLLIGLSVIVGMAAGFSLPAGETFPIHWNARGEVDGYGTRRMVILVLLSIPATMVFMQGVFWGLPKLDGIREQLEPSARLYGIAWIGTMVFTAVTQLVMAWLIVSLAQRAGTDAATDMPSDMADTVVRVTGISSGALMILLGNYFGKIKRNLVFGIRTPFTLTSTRAWEQTHRIGGRLFVALGLGIIGVTWLRPYWGITVLVVGLTALVAWAFAYSYSVWKSDPERS